MGQRGIAQCIGNGFIVVHPGVHAALDLMRRQTSGIDSDPDDRVGFPEFGGNGLQQKLVPDDTGIDPDGGASGIQRFDRHFGSELNVCNHRYRRSRNNIPECFNILRRIY